MTDGSTSDRPVLKWEVTVHDQVRVYSMSFGEMGGMATAAVWDDAMPERMVFIPADALMIATQQGWMTQSKTV